MTAPAGYGKTTLVSDWARQLDRPVRWLSLDDKDNDLIRFWNYFMKAIEQAIGSLSDSVRTSNAMLSPGQYEPFMVALLNRLNGLNEPVILILDDWHVINNTDIRRPFRILSSICLPACIFVSQVRSIHGFLKSRWISRDWIRKSIPGICVSICRRQWISSTSWRWGLQRAD